MDIERLVASLEAIAPKAWALLVQAERIEAMTDLALCAMWFLLLGSAAYVFRALARKAKEKEGPYSEPEAWYWIGFWLCALGVFIVALVSVSTAVRLLNPEVFAAKSLVEKAHP